MTDILFAVVFLTGIAVVNAVCLTLLLGKKASPLLSLKLVGVARALNVFLFSGTGYIAAGYFARDRKMSFSQTVSAFLVIEVFSALAWLALGVFFGVQYAAWIPLAMIVCAAVVLIAVRVRRSVLRETAVSLKKSIQDIGTRTIFAFPCIGAMIGLYMGYYFFLAAAVGIDLTVPQVIRAVSVAFCLGYFSPAPAGLGFKETGLVAILAGMGVEVSSAVTLAVVDRIVLTVFWGSVGTITGYGVIRDEFRKRSQRGRTPP